MRTNSTKQVAKMVGVHWTTLHRWLRGGSVKPSQSLRMNGVTLWRWTARDVERVRKWKAAHYRKGRGRKKKAERR